MSSANYQNQLRQQQIAEDMQRRGYSLNEINAILTGQQ
jgi:SOS response regulatory protein OraA/RecX